jgi:hypothetical protein
MSDMSVGILAFRWGVCENVSQPYAGPNRYSHLVILHALDMNKTLNYTFILNPITSVNYVLGQPLWEGFFLVLFLFFCDSESFEIVL